MTELQILYHINSKLQIIGKTYKYMLVLAHKLSNLNPTMTFIISVAICI